MRIKALSIRKKLLLVVLILTAVVTSLSITTTLKYEYEQEKEIFDKTLKLIENGYIAPMAEFAYNLEPDQLQRHINGLAELPEVAQVEITLEKNNVFLRALNSNFPRHPDDDLQIIPLKRITNKESTVIGELKIVFRQHIIKENMIEKTKFFVSLQIIRSLILGLVLIAIFYRLFGLRIKQLSNYLRQLDQTQFQKIEKLPHSKFLPIFNAHDELSYLFRITKKMARHTAHNYNTLNARVTAAEMQVEEERARAIYASKMATLGEMAAGVSHEINNPLAILNLRMNHIKKLVEKMPPDSKQQLTQEIDKALGMSNRIERIVKGLKKFARDGSSDPTEFYSVNSICNEVVELMRQRIAKNEVNLEIICDPDIEVECRPVEISQVLVNLISNSIDAIQDQAERWIEVRVTNAGEQSGFLFIRITDSGQGIPQTIHEKIMNPFFTTKTAGNGTGLGLSISKGIIENHGGRLELVKNSPYTCFEIKFPMVQNTQKVAA